jgi:hypothetical protein
VKKILPNNFIKIEDICVLLIGYNRPELLQKRIIELQNSLVSNIYISIDGDAESSTSEMEEVKTLAKNILSDKKLILNHHKRNLGLVLHVTKEISKVLNLYKYVIVVEDDVKISKNFINNMVAGLNKLEELGLRGIVSGYSPLFQDTFNNKWRKTHICFLWGWACSSDVWKVYNYDLSTVEVENRLLESKTWKKLNSYQKKFWLYKIKEVQTIETKAAKMREKWKEKVTIKKENQTMRMKEKITTNNNTDTTKENLKKYSLGTNKVQVIRIIIWSQMNK